MTLKQNNPVHGSQAVFRKATQADVPEIWQILQGAILRRKLDGSQQWQNGYPNLDVVNEDVIKGQCFVLEVDGQVAASSALIFNDEPAYENIEGEWLSDGDFLVVHRVAVSDKFIGRGLIKKMFAEFEEFSRKQGVFSIKVDTNFDNLAMLAILEKLGYSYCGEVFLAGGKRKAFQKLLA